MATDYGTDVAAIDDLPDPEALVSDEMNVAYALARRLLTPAGAYEEIGDPDIYDSIDLRDYLGKRISETARADLEAAANRVLAEDPRVATVTATVTFAAGVLSVRVVGDGSDGPFSFVATVNLLTGDVAVS
jgi:hypothetical protein